MAVSISVASGKGGVGKTSIAVNLALTLATMGSRVALLDADFGLANAHILLGLKPRTNQSFLAASGLKDMVDEGPSGLKLYSGGNGLTEMLNLDQNFRYNLIRSFDPVASDCDFLFIDTPAGASDSTISFLSASQKVLIVLVGEPTSFSDAYGVIKAARLEGRVTEFSVIVNQEDSGIKAKELFTKFKKITTSFLNDVSLSYIGHFPQSKLLRNSIIARKPLFLKYGKSKEANLFKSTAKQLLHSPNNSPSGIKFFNNGSN